MAREIDSVASVLPGWRRAMIEGLEFTRAWALPEADLARFLQLSRWA